MTDPFDALRRPITPVDPAPAFAARLRARIERALTLPQGVTVSDLNLNPQPDPAEPGSADSEPADTPHHGDVAYVAICLPDLDRGVAFYETVLGCTYGEPLGDLGRQASGVRPRHGVRVGPVGENLVYYVVDDVAAAAEAVRAAGGRADAPRPERFGMVADCVDDQGMSLALVEGNPAWVEPRVPLNGGNPGDIGYLTLGVRDSARTRAFLGAVLHWTFTEGRVADGWEPAGVHPMSGMHGGNDHASAVPMYRVDDVSAAAERVRAAGGTATEPALQPYGWSVDCTDDQGSSFYLWTP